MDYELIYDAANESFADWGFIAIGLILSLVGAVMAFVPQVQMLLMKKYSRQYTRTFSLFFFGFAVLWTLFAGTLTLNQNNETKSASADNSCTLLEGKVESFVPMPHSGHQDEVFSLQNVKFKYSDYNLTGGFNNTASHGGPISEGLQVRLCYFYRHRTKKNIIVRLEVAR